MKIIDLFIYKVWTFAVNKLKKDKSDAKFSAYLYLIIYSAFFSLGLMVFIGFLWNNPISLFFLHHSFVSVFISTILFAIIYGFRYYKYVSMELIEKRYLKHDLLMQRRLRHTVSLLVIGIPVFSFIFFRLYLHKYSF